MMGIVLVAISLGGVFNTVLLETRQRTRELAVLKAVGMTPRQVVVLVLCSVAPLALVAGLLGVPLGLLSQRAVLGYMGDPSANTAIPDSAFDVFPPLLLAGLAARARDRGRRRVPAGAAGRASPDRARPSGGIGSEVGNKTYDAAMASGNSTDVAARAALVAGAAALAHGDDLGLGLRTLLDAVARPLGIASAAIVVRDR